MTVVTSLRYGSASAFVQVLTPRRRTVGPPTRDLNGRSYGRARFVFSSVFLEIGMICFSQHKHD